jgi:hypothetical protein
MAYPTTQPAFTVREPKVALSYIGSTATDPAGQVRAINPQTNATREEQVYRRLGDQTAHTEYGATTYRHPVNITFFHGAALDELAAIIGQSGQETDVELDTDNVVDEIRVDVYSDNSATAEKETTWTVTNFTPLTMNPNFDADAGAPTIEVSGEAESLKFTHNQQTP